MVLRESFDRMANCMILLFWFKLEKRMQVASLRPGSLFCVNGVNGLTYMKTQPGILDGAGREINAIDLCGVAAKPGALKALNPFAEVTFFDGEVLGLSNRYI